MLQATRFPYDRCQLRPDLSAARRAMYQPRLWLTPASASCKVTYDFMERMTDGLFRAQGVPFACHLVRTASITLSTGAPLPVVQAAMVHAALPPEPVSRQSTARMQTCAYRRHVQATLGADVEALVHAYGSLPWYSMPKHWIDTWRTSIPQTETTRNVLTIRLADECEDWLDLSLALRGHAPRWRSPPGRLRRKVYSTRRTPGTGGSWQTACEMYCLAIPGSQELPEAVVVHRNRAYERPRHHLWERSVPRSMAVWILPAASCVHPGAARPDRHLVITTRRRLP